MSSFQTVRGLPVIFMRSTLIVLKLLLVLALAFPLGKDIYSFSKENNRFILFLDILVEKTIPNSSHPCMPEGTYLHRRVSTLKFFLHEEAENKFYFCARPQSFGHLLFQSSLHAELTYIRSIFRKNGCSDNVVNTVLFKKIQHFHKSQHFDPKKCPLYLRLPWLENVSTSFENQIKTVIKRCFFGVEPRIVYTS